MGILNSNQDMKTAGMAVLAAAFLAGFRFCDFGPRHRATRNVADRLQVDVGEVYGERARSGKDDEEPVRVPGAYYPEPVDAPTMSGDSMLPMVVAGLGGATVFGAIGLVGFFVLRSSDSGGAEGELGDGEESEALEL